MVTIIKNVNVFNGTELTTAGAVAFENGIITGKTEGDIVIDGKGCTLLPGLIDSHIHLYKLQNLQEAAAHGITTMLDMGTRSPEVVDRLKNQPALPDIRSSYSPAFAQGSNMPEKMGFPESSTVSSPADAQRFVNEQLACGADYIKVILEEQNVNGGGVLFPVDVLTAIVGCTHQNGKRVIAHVISPNTFKTAIEAGVDVLTHIPFAAPLPQPLIEMKGSKGVISVPTMFTMKGIVEKIKGVNPNVPFDYNYVRQSVAAMHKAGITIIAGSDSNTDDPTTPFSAPYGSSLLSELGLLVEAGLTPVEALQSATCIPAEYFGLHDRGMIKAGYRADLLLVQGDPTVDINSIKNIKQVWISGNALIR